MNGYEVNWLELAAAAVGAWSVWLSTREHLWAWPTAIVNVLLYVIVFREARLYADMGLQAVYAVISAYGWYHWKHGGANDTMLAVSRARGVTWAWLAGVAAAGSLGLARLLATTTDAALPQLDATLSVTSLAAQWMMTRKLLENWLVWIVLDVVYVGMFTYKSLYVTAGLYAVFLVLATMGWFSWRESLRRQAA
ncbi:MAG: nicotinamide mononucleotide transporter [Gemmatimonadetes bacterium]|nr:nicotinamide mononucleotide transporter [Gemmatimonadota bacterium]